MRNLPPRISQDPRDPAFVQDPYAFYARMHETSAVFFWEEYGLWAFSGYEAVNALLRDRRFGRQILHVATREELGWPERPVHLADFDRVERWSLLELEPPNHTRLRKLVNRAFVSRQVEKLRPQLEALCNQLIDGFSGASTDILQSYATPLPLTTICNLLGVPVEAGPKLLEWSHAIVRMYVLDPPMEDQIAANAAARDFSDFLKDHIAEHRKRPKDDLLSTLIAVEEEGEHLTTDELISTVVVLLNAGHEATVHQMGNALKSVMESGIAPSKLFADRAATEATVEESLRHDAPLHMFTRWALEDMVLSVDGADIALKKGDEIALLLGAANRDPRVFDRPHIFDPARSPQGNVTFGAGIHFCIGAPLARLELQVGLETLFRRMPDLRLGAPLHYRDVYHFHGLERFVLA